MIVVLVAWYHFDRCTTLRNASVVLFHTISEDVVDECMLLSTVDVLVILGILFSPLLVNAKLNFWMTV